jgi:beta-glucosidase
MSRRVEELIKEMTLKEKVGQLNLISYKENLYQQIIEGRIGSIINSNDFETNYKLQEAAQKSRLKIPLLIGADVIHGFKTIYPVPLGEACSFNLDLIKRGSYLSMLEARDEGVNWIYAPMLDLINDLRFGRVMETGGEDPYLSSEIGKVKVNAIQTEYAGIKTAATAKHFLGYGASEAGLDYSTSEFSEQKMRNYYLPQYKAAIDEGVFTVMNAFTTYNDLPVAQSKYILKNVLRDELGFEGILVTDWQSLDQLKKFKTVRNDKEAAKIGINNGIDVDMHTSIYYEYLEKLIEEDKSIISKIDESVRRILTVKEKMGLFEYPYPKRIDESIHKEIKNHAIEIAEESVILFKNDNNILPLHVEKKVLVVGLFTQDQDIHLGAWSSLGKSMNVISLGKGLHKEFKNLSYYDIPKNYEEIDYAKLEKALVNLDCVILFFGEPRSYSGENNCRVKIDLPFMQEKFLKFISKYNLPIISVVTAGRPLAIPIVDELSAAVIWNFNLGYAAGDAIAKVISGRVNPSAKTVITFPKEIGQMPIYYNRYNIGREELINYVDGDINPLYPFGFGLSYSKFKYSSLEVLKTANKLIVDFQIENISSVDGKEIAQVYLITDYEAKLVPKKRLIKFEKFTIKRHETIDVNMEIYFDEKLYPGEYSIQVGPSSNDGIAIKIL